MVLKVFAVYDSKARSFLQPFFSVNGAVAVRAFESASNDERHDFHRFAGDYELFEIGEWDDHSGELTTLEHRSSLGLASSFLKPQGPRLVPPVGGGS